MHFIQNSCNFLCSVCSFVSSSDIACSHLKYKSTFFYLNNNNNNNNTTNETLYEKIKKNIYLYNIKKKRIYPWCKVSFCSFLKYHLQQFFFIFIFPYLCYISPTHSLFVFFFSSFLSFHIVQDFSHFFPRELKWVKK